MIKVTIYLRVSKLKEHRLFSIESAKDKIPVMKFTVKSSVATTNGDTLVSGPANVLQALQSADCQTPMLVDDNKV